MKGPNQRAQWPEQPDSRKLWQVPHPHLETESARRDAIAIADWIMGDRGHRPKPDEHALFVALHTCAFKADQGSRGRREPTPQACDWVGRWRRIREYIVEQNVGLAYSMVSRFRPSRFDEDDLVSDAMLGLARAVDRFNPWKGYQFSTYACNVIARALMRRGKREANHRRLFPVQIGLPSEPRGAVPDTRAELHLERLARALDRNLGGLTDLESRIVAHRFPDRGRARLTFREIGEAIGLSKERVRQIQNVALSKLRDVLSADPVLQ